MRWRPCLPPPAGRRNEGWPGPRRERLRAHAGATLLGGHLDVRDAARDRPYVRENRLHVLLVERAHEPYRGYAALPGGFLHGGEDLRQAAGRVLAEETGLDRAVLHLEQLAAYGAPDRDPSGRVVSVAYLAFAPDLPIPTGGPDVRSARWAPAHVIRGALAFDHAGILDDAIERAGARLEYTTLATAFCGPAFTIGDLRTIYEAVWDTPLDPRNFNRKVIHTEGFVVPTGDKRIPGTGRPAALYRRGPATALSPPLLRSTTASAESSSR